MHTLLNQTKICGLDWFFITCNTLCPSEMWTPHFRVTVTNVCPNCVLTTSVRQTLVYLIRKIAAEWNNWDCFIYPKIASRLPFLRVYMPETQTKLWQHRLVGQIQTVVPTKNMPKASEVRTLPNSRHGAVGPMVSALVRFHCIHVG